MTMKMINSVFTEPHLRHSDTHLSSRRERQMETRHFFLLCCLRTGLLTLRNTAAKPWGTESEGLCAAAMRSKKL